MGKEQQRLLRFAIQYPGWHSVGCDKAIRTIRNLADMGLLETNEQRQFRLALSENVYAKLNS